MKSPGPAYAPRPHLDPRQLLDPKGYNAIHRKKDMDSPIAEAKAFLDTTNSGFTDASQKRVQGGGEENGMGNMIERVHNITDRPERPRKRRKTDKDDNGDEQIKAGFSGGGKGGEIGEYMKQKREEGQKESGTSQAIIDLTKGETCPDFRKAI